MSNSVNLLVVEDNPADSDLIREYLSEVKDFDANMDCVSTLQDAKGFLKNNSVHAVLIDLSLPDSRGLNTVKEVMEHLKNAPAIVLTSMDDHALALAAIESGAQDYVLKGALNPDVLARVIRHSVQRRKWLLKLSEIQEQFYRSQKIESVGRLAGGVAHDFNNQLGTILLLSSLIADHLPEDHEALKYLDRIREVTERSADLVRRLMVFCRQNSSRPVAFNLGQLLLNNEKLFTKLMGAAVDVEILCDDNAQIFADAGLIEQAITNLVLNARDAMASGGKLILKATVDHSHAKIGRVILTVTDTGCGIPEDLREKIFDPFFTTKEVGKGTGLGLSMVHGAISQSGGSISLESELNQGTTFTLVFPLYEGQENAPDERSSARSKTGAGETILLVEDEDLLRGAAAEFLQNSGYKVIAVSNGLEALREIENGLRPGLVVTDIVMPKMSGTDLLRQILKTVPEVKTVFVSGYSAETDSLKGLNEKNVTFLQKPFSPKHLFSSIQDLLAKGP